MGLRNEHFSSPLCALPAQPGRGKSADDLGHGRRWRQLSSSQRAGRPPGPVMAYRIEQGVRRVCTRAAKRAAERWWPHQLTATLSSNFRLQSKLDQDITSREPMPTGKQWLYQALWACMPEIHRGASDLHGERPRRPASGLCNRLIGRLPTWGVRIHALEREPNVRTAWTRQRRLGIEPVRRQARRLHSCPNTSWLEI